MSLLQNSNAISAGGYDINKSLRFRSSASAYLNRTPASAGNRQKFTLSVWIKLGELGTNKILLSSNTTAQQFRIYTDNTIGFGNSGVGNYQSTGVLRDPSAWYHIVCKVDTTLASGKVIIYVNNQTYLTTDGGLSLNANTQFNNTVAHFIGRDTESPNAMFFDGYMAEYNFIDGQSLTPSSFGETDAVTGSWVAKKYTGTYGNNGFYLPFTHTETNENLLTYSEQFDNAAWTKYNTTITANTVASPLYSSVVADSLYETTANDEHFLQYAVSNPVTTTEHTFSCYVKYINRRYIRLRTVYLSGASDLSATFDLVDGVVTSNAALYATITSVGGGWYRISMTTKTLNPNPSSNWLHRIHCENDTAAGTYAGDVTQGYHIFGAQVSYGTTTKDYIATTASTITPRGTTENAFTWSQGFNDASWAKNASTITANTTTAPDGTTTASKLVENTASGQHGIYRGITESNITRTLSVYAKLADASRPYVYIEMSDFTAYATNAIFNLSNGTIYQQPNNNPNYTNASASITSVGNGWYRCILTATKGSVNPNNNTQIALCDSAGNVSYTGSGTTLGAFIWGAQLEETSSVGPYLPTVASAQSKVFRIGADKSLGATGFGYDSWIPNNISLTPGTTYDAMTDVPTNTSETVANYAVMNPIWKSSNLTLAGANLNVTSSGNGGSSFSTIAMESGKYYCEATINTGSDATIVGIANSVFNPTTATLTAANAVSYYGNSGDKFVNGTSSAYGASYTTGDIIGIALDITAGTVTFYKNNTSQGAITHGLTGPFYFATSDASSGSNINQSWNFGQRPFSYTPPTGYKALNTFNLPDSTILKGNRVMDATTWSGNGTSATISNSGSMKPDLVWIKARSTSSYGHYLIDAIRGVTKLLSSQDVAAEITAADVITSLNSNGFSLSNSVVSNGSGQTYVGWQWQAGQGSTTTGTGTGGITSVSYSVNTTAGFSIVTYTGSGTTGTITHGLGVAPSMIFTKTRSSAAGNWGVYHSAIGATKVLNLNNTIAATTSSAFWNNTAPTLSVFTVATSNDVNASATTMVAYCWAEIAGFSKFGSYTGNGSADGTFVYLGFKPKFLMIKRTDTTQNWIMVDTSRDTYNVANKRLFANLTSAEDTGISNYVDLLSNGFKCRDSNISYNASGGTYIYMAFAENPFKNANAR